MLSPSEKQSLRIVREALNGLLPMNEWRSHGYHQGVKCYEIHHGEESLLKAKEALDVLEGMMK